MEATMTTQERIQEAYRQRLEAARKRDDAQRAFMLADTEYRSATSKYVQLLEDYFAEVQTGRSVNGLA